MFHVGDAIVHPARGAGIVVGFGELQQHGISKRYYRIELLGYPGASLMVPVARAGKAGLRPAISPSRLKSVWRVLRAAPEPLPSDHKVRHSLLGERLSSGGTLETAKVVRDMYWRQRKESSLTGQGKRIYQRAMNLLASEIAAVQGIGLADAEAQIRVRLGEHL